MTVRYSREDLLRVIYALADEIAGSEKSEGYSCVVPVIADTDAPHVSPAKLRAIAEDAVAEVET